MRGAERALLTCDPDLVPHPSAHLSSVLLVPLCAQHADVAAHDRVFLLSGFYSVFTSGRCRPEIVECAEEAPLQFLSRCSCLALTTALVLCNP